jgi:hypothetical protein
VLSVTNSTFNLNFPFAMETDSGVVTVNYSTLYATNTASIVVNSGALTLTNVDSGRPAPNCFESVTDGGYNLVSDRSCGLTKSTSSIANPLLAIPLANNGRPTETIGLTPASPAIGKIPYQPISA